MKIVFFGTDDFSVVVLEELKKAGFIPALIITAPDKPKGRGLVFTPSPAKIWAETNSIPVSSDYQLLTTNYSLFIVASYGKIIPKRILDIPKYGALNVHPSLLPRYRGPSPIESQILADEKDIGVSIMQMDEQMDHGPTLEYWKLDTGNWKEAWPPKASELRKLLAREGGKLLAETIPKWVLGEIKAVPQDESKATYTKKFTKKEDGRIDLEGDAKQNFLKIRAFEGSIGTYFYTKKSSPSPSFNKGGEGGGFSTQRIRVKITDAAFENNTFRILRVIPEGRKEMPYEDFLRGIK